MIDDHKYSIGRTVVYRHPQPKRPDGAYGQHGAERTAGMVTDIQLTMEPEPHWVYAIRNSFTREVAEVFEEDIFFATLRRRRRSGRQDPPSGPADEDRPQDLGRAITRWMLSQYLDTTVRDLIRREEAEELAKRQGRNLPLESGDYIRIRGSLRKETEPYHNQYAKVVEVTEPDVPNLLLKSGESYAVVNKYRIVLENGTTAEIYDPEVKLYYTSQGRATVLNWRAATFLAESFGDEPPYSVEYSFLEDHVFTRKELEELEPDQLMHILASLLYVKGRMGLRDYEKKEEHFEDLPREHMVDSILSISRFNMRRNRGMTEQEIRQKHTEIRRLKGLLRGW